MEAISLLDELSVPHSRPSDSRRAPRERESLEELLDALSDEAIPAGTQTRQSITRAFATLVMSRVTAYATDCSLLHFCIRSESVRFGCQLKFAH